MKILILRTAIFLLMSALLISILNYFYIYPFDNYVEQYYKKKFLTVSGVNSVKDYLHYEGTKSITIELDDHKQISIWGFSRSIFKKTDWIGFSSINGVSLNCSQEINGHPVGINIISFIDNSSLRIDVKNIGDLVKSYDVIYDYILTFPTKYEEAIVIKMDNLVTKNKKHWCYITK